LYLCSFLGRWRRPTPPTARSRPWVTFASATSAPGRADAGPLAHSGADGAASNSQGDLRRTWHLLSKRSICQAF
jgi:hypothetical protein